MRNLYESILDNLDGDKETADRINSHIMVLKLDKFSKDYLTEEQWKYIAAYVKSNFPEIYEMTATKGDYYNLDSEKNAGLVNDRPSVDIRVKYSKYRVNRNNNLRAMRVIGSAVCNIEGLSLRGRDHLERSHIVRDSEGVYNLHFSDRARKCLEDPKSALNPLFTKTLNVNVKELMNDVKIKNI